MKKISLLAFAFSLALALLLCDSAACWANPNTGVPINLHRRFVVQQTKRKAAQGQPTRRNVGVWLSGGYERTVSNARSRSSYRARPRLFRRR